jgi:hypothetical protein
VFVKRLISSFVVVAFALSGCRGRESSATSGATETIAPAQPQPGTTETDAMTQTVDIEDGRSEADGATLAERGTDTVATPTTTTPTTTTPTTAPATHRAKPLKKH